MCPDQAAPTPEVRVFPDLAALSAAAAEEVARRAAGSGLVSYCLARRQRTPKRARVARIVSSLTRVGVSPSAKLTAAANSNVHTLGG